MTINATTADAYDLLHQGVLALADVEANGMRVDVGRLDRTIVETGRKIEEITAELQRDQVWKSWKRRYRDKASIGSRMQLATVLGDELSPGKKRTATGRTSVDEEALEQIDLPFVKGFLRLEKLKKLKSTYLVGVQREVVDGLVHPSFNLHLVRTHRSSSDSPNFQNIPIRDKEIGELIRSCFVPRKGRLLVEVDYSAIEVRIAACYHQDPTMIKYIEDPTKDMHRDMAAECYMLEQGQVTKEARFYAKNQFVFPEFYGSYYVQCAPNLWNAIDRAGLKVQMPNGEPGRSLKAHLEDQGIDGLGDCDPRQKPRKGTFEHHIQQVEQDFWGRRFRVYAKWKQDWHRQYLKQGWFDLLTGFRIAGVYGRNDVINYPVQGVAFHCLLWSLVRLVKWLKKNRMKTVIVGQIHDSIVADVHPDELDDFLAMAKRVMTGDIRKHWGWIIVPLEIEAESSETNWFDKRKVEL
jgi:DNA polymerase-1